MPTATKATISGTMKKGLPCTQNKLIKMTNRARGLGIMSINISSMTPARVSSK